MLIDAYHLYLAHESGHDTIKMVEHILKQALIGIRLFVDTRHLNDTAHNRLAFREFGLAIGLRSIIILSRKHSDNYEHFLGEHSKQTFKDISLTLEALRKFTHLADSIESFWQDDRHQRERSWLHHIDINEVMLATSLCPIGFLSNWTTIND
jgi:hypothetical protein